ncbi:hypothetical protein Moror_2263 [Moniliophthora roreri MCA 2997]|uniref:Uncharacterized protein n=1 Tax=Moniliophthora roreri (strain MCA 2997) TaxID=1381753 RepID=V2WL07_MONRO|nr:hypothetical protein Moror_2263 [Moniliophthora roreri MCA 2997]
MPPQDPSQAQSQLPTAHLKPIASPTTITQLLYTMGSHESSVCLDGVSKDKCADNDNNSSSSSNENEDGEVDVKKALVGAGPSTSAPACKWDILMSKEAEALYHKSSTKYYDAMEQAFIDWWGFNLDLFAESEEGKDYVPPSLNMFPAGTICNTEDDR